MGCARLAGRAAFAHSPGMNILTPINTPRVLLVEDSLPIRERMRTLIEEAGPVTVIGEAESVAQARLLFHQHAPDAVVLDLQLADDTSYQLLEEMKHSHPGCVVMVLTNFAVPAYRERCVALGADHFFEKSTEFGCVVEVLSALRGSWVSTVPGMLAAPGRRGRLPLPDPQHWGRADAGSLLQCVATAVYACDTEGRITFHNAAAAALWGGEPPMEPNQWCGTQRLYEVMGQPVTLDAYPTRVAIAQMLTGGALAGRELIVRRPDGSRRHVLSYARPWLDAAGTLAGAIDTMLDITESRQADVARLQREGALQRALDASRLALWDLDFESGRVLLSEGWSEMMGRPRAPSTTTFGTLAGLVPVEDQALIAAAMKPAIDGASTSYSVEHRVRTPAGDTLWILCEGKVVERDEQGRAVRAIGTNRDITERKCVEIAMAEREAKFRALVELSVDWHWEQDAQFRFTRLSSHNADHAGVSGEAHLGKTRWELPHVGLSDADWQHHREQLERREPFRDFEISRPGLNGKLHTISVSGMPLFDALGRFCGYCGVSRDITAQRAAEAAARALETQLCEAQKLEALGTLAGSIAHDFNNIVGAILGNLALARDDIAAGRTGLVPLEQIHKVALRARTLAQQILSFSRRQPQVHVNQALRPLVEEAVAMLRTMLPPSAALHTQLTHAVLDVRADATQLQQLLMNLCINASHALEGIEGRIEIGLDEVRLCDPSAAVTGDLPPGRYARLWVHDSGHGMDAETQARIFEPFFTTKLHGQGTGLGLAIVRNIVAAHNGAIGVASAPGQGCTFDIYLPAVDQETGAMPLDLLEASTPVGANQHVLVVDDDEVMRLLMTTMLERAGYRVTYLGDAREALAAVREQPDRFDIVVTDFNMREMSGLDLARNLAKLRGDLPVVMASGHLSDESREQARRVGLRAVLQKENTAEQLGPLIQRVLAAHEEATPHNRPRMFEA